MEDEQRRQEIDDEGAAGEEERASDEPEAADGEDPATEGPEPQGHSAPAEDLVDRAQGLIHEGLSKRDA